MTSAIYNKCQTFQVILDFMKPTSKVRNISVMRETFKKSILIFYLVFIYLVNVCYQFVMERRTVAFGHLLKLGCVQHFMSNVNTV